MNKSVAMAGAVLVALIPWWSGGRASVALLISAFGLLIGAIMLWRRPGTAKTVASWPLRVVGGAITIWATLGITWSVNRYDSELWLAYWALAATVFILAANLGPQAKVKLISGYVWVASITAVYGLYLYLSGDYDRLTSSFYWANPAAAYLLPAVLIAVWRWATARSPIVLAQATVLLMAFWLTDSRGATLVIILATLAALTSRIVRQKAVSIGLLAVLTFGLAAGFSWIRVNNFHHSGLTPGSRFAEAAQGESTSARDRLSYIESSARIWLKNPVQGTGPGTYGTVHPQYQQQVTQASNDAHNIFAQTLAEQGIIGVLLTVWLVWLLLIGLFRGVRLDSAMGVVALSAVALGLHFGIDIDGRYPALIALLAALIGVVYQPILHVSVNRRRAASLPVLLGILLGISLSAYQSSVWADKGVAANETRDYMVAANAYSQAHTGAVYNPDHWTAEGIDYYTLASITNGSKQYNALALDRANHAIAIDPQDSQHYFLRARIERLTGKLDAAEGDYRRTLELDGLNHPEYYVDLASLLLQKGDQRAAVETATQGIDLYPQKVIDNRNADVRVPGAISQLYTIRAAVKLQDGRDASADINSAIKLFPLNIEAQNLRAKALGK